MASTHTQTTLSSAVANTTGSTTNSTAFDNRTSYGGVIFGKMVNGTAPTTACTAQLQWSNDNSTWYNGPGFASAGITASATYFFAFKLDPGVSYARVTFVGNTGQTVTVTALCSSLTTI